MKVSQLENILKEVKDTYGDIDILFNRYDKETDIKKECFVKIEVDRTYKELNVTVMKY